MIVPVTTPQAPTPAGHYVQALVHNGVVYVAGQLAIDPATGAKKLGSIEEQAEQVLKNVAAILEAAGSDLAHVLKLTVYLSDMAQWGKVNAICARLFGAHKPARSVVPTRELHHGFQIEIDAVAAVR